MMFGFIAKPVIIMISPLILTYYAVQAFLEDTYEEKSNDFFDMESNNWPN